MAKGVVCLETGEIYKSSAAAARAIGVTCQSIRDAVYNGTRSGGRHWYQEGRYPGDAFFKGGRSIPVRCVETGESFESIAEAARAKGVSKSGIIQAVSGRCGGFHWEKL